MRLAFLGTPEAAVPSLVALVDAGHDVALVVTRPDRRRGRGSALSPSPVKAAALARGLRVAHRLAELGDVEVERAVVVAYGAIIPAAMLERTPMLNVHFSLLPRWRGAAPVQRAILAGDEETGVTIISLEPTLDTGPVHLERRVRVDEKSASELTTELAHVGAAALLEVLASHALLDHPTIQVGEVTYAEKLSKETLHLTPLMSAEVALRVVRVGGAFFFVDGRRVGVIAARASEFPAHAGELVVHEGEVVLGTNDGALALDVVRPEGSGSMKAADWWRGRRHEGQSPWS